MSTKSKREIGIEIFKRCYGSSLMEPPAEGVDPFFDIMLEGLFGTVWAREEILSLRERRLFTMGIIAANGEADVFGIQCGCALRNGEMNETQLRELVIHAAPYAGYPRVSNLRSATEKAIRDFNKESEKEKAKETKASQEKNE